MVERLTHSKIVKFIDANSFRNNQKELEKAVMKEIYKIPQTL